MLLAGVKSIPTDEQEKLQTLKTWNWGDLKCPSGHRIPKPQIVP